MKAVVLAAGEGTRLRPLTANRPKVLLPIANKPILQYVVEALAGNGINDLSIVVGYGKEKIMRYFEDGRDFGVSINYVVQEKQLGTAHALSQIKRIEKPFLVVAGDNIVEASTISPLFEQMDTSLLITESEVPSKYGVVLEERGELKKIVEKPAQKISNLISIGVYLFTPKIFGEITKSGATDLTSVIQYLLNKKYKIACKRTKGKWADVVYPWDLLSVNAEVLADTRSWVGGTLESNVVIKGQVHIGKDTIVRSGSYIVGPVIIGEQCEIGPHTCIFPSTSIKNNVTLKPFTEVKNSLVMDDVRIGSSSVISNSVISNGSIVGAKFINEATSAWMKLTDGYHEVKKIGAIVGEDSWIGNSVSVEAGKIIGANCRIAPKNRVSTNIPDNTVVA